MAEVLPRTLQVAQPPEVSARAGREHLVKFFETEDALVETAATFLGEGLRATERVCAFVTLEHQQRFTVRLKQEGVDVAHALEAGQLIFVDAHEALGQILKDGQPDPAQFEGVVTPVLKSLLASGAPVRAYGEMVDVLWAQGNREGALKLEELWNALQKKYPFSLLCTYAIAGFYKQPAAMQDVCARHGTVLPHPPAHEGELTRQLNDEIARRKEVELVLREKVEELRKVQLRLTLELEERTRNEAALRESEKQLQAITDALPGLVLYVDADQCYRYVNATFMEWFDTPPTSVLGKTMREVLGDDAYAIVKPHIKKALQGKLAHFTATLPFLGGPPRAIEATYVPRPGPHGQSQGFVALVSDVTERLKLEQFRAATAERASRLLKITAAIADAVTKEQVLAALCDHLATAVSADNVALWVTNDDGRTARLERAIGYAPRVQEALSTISVDDQPMPMPAIDALKTGKPVWINTKPEMLQSYPTLKPLTDDRPTYRVACLPLVARDQVLGVLGLTFEQPGLMPDDDRSLLLVVSRYAAQALERLRLFESERRAAGRLGVISRASRALVEASQNLSTVLQTTVDEIIKEYAEAAGVMLLSPDGRRLTLAAIQHRHPGTAAAYRALLSEIEVPADEGLLGAVATTGQAVRLSHYDHRTFVAKLPPQYQSLADALPEKLMALPLISSGRVLGVVAASRPKDDSPFDEQDQAVLEELAKRAATAIENSRLYQENLVARSRAEELYRFAQATVTATKVEQVYEAALDAIDHALLARRASILTFDGEELMHFRAWRGLSSEYRAAVDGHSPWTKHSVDPKTIVIADAWEDPSMAKFLPTFEKEGIRALAFIPLVTGGRLLGKFMVYYDEPHPFTSAELELANAIAHHLASVTERFEAINRLEDIVHYHELFAGILAHDLRNPLSAILTTAQLLLRRQEGEGDRVTKPLGRIMVSGERMSRMIEQLLDFTRSRVGGGIAPVHKGLDLGELAVQAIGELELAYPEWNIELRAEGVLLGKFDPDRLLQVFSNLVANAGQHGMPGSPVMVKLDGTRRDQVVVEVSNQGVVPAEILPNLFDPFRGTRYRHADKSRGLGLGLFITREIVEAHSGTVEVISTPEAGTTFRVTLPRNGTRS